MRSNGNKSNKSKTLFNMRGGDIAKRQIVLFIMGIIVIVAPAVTIEVIMNKRDKDTSDHENSVGGEIHIRAWNILSGFCGVFLIVLSIVVK